MADGSPLNIGSPWNAVSGLPGSADAPDPIPEMANLQRSFGIGPNAMPPAQLQGQEETDRALENLRQWASRRAAFEEAAKRPSPPTSISLTTGPDGKQEITAKMDAESAQILMQHAQNWQQTLGGYAKEMDSIEQQIRAQEAQIRSQPPWVQLATALSANLAQAKDMPGWVQAAGRTSAQLNPRPEELQARRMAVLGPAAGIAEKGAALDIAMARTIEDRATRTQNKATQEENQLEDNYRQVQQKIESEVTTNKRVTPEQEQALRVVGAQMKRTPQRIEADLARMRSGATASAEALAEQRKFETDKAKELAREADQRLNKTIGAQDRRQAQGQLVTALIPLYKEASWQTKDQDLLQDMSRLDQTFESFLKSHGAAGGPIAGRAAKLMAAFGDPKSQELLRDQAQVLIDVLKSSGLSFARTSEKEMSLIFESLTRATNNPKVALDTAVRYQKWGDKVRERLLQERYAGQYSIVAPYMPTSPLVSGEARPDWQKVQEKHRATVTKPGTLEEKVLNLPKLIGEVAGESGLMKEIPQRPTATNPTTGETVEWDGKAWVKK